MSGAQGVILILLGILVLYLLWAKGSPINQVVNPPGSGQGQNRTAVR